MKYGGSFTLCFIGPKYGNTKWAHYVPHEIKVKEELGETGLRFQIVATYM